MSKSQSPLSRRTVLAGAGTAGALAAAAAALPLKTAETTAAVATAQPEPTTGEGYRPTAHVMHYYRTARV